MLLSDIKQMHLNFSEKITIIFEIAVIFFHLHDKGYVYHDLKPNNSIINENKNAVLFDLDRMINVSELKSIRTADFGSKYVAPEVNNGAISYENDVYSICQLIYFIINEKDPKPDDCILHDNHEYSEFCFSIQFIYNKCAKAQLSQRPSIYVIKSW